MKKYDVIIIGAGISGITAAALLAKKGQSVCVIESANKSGGSCGIFKRCGVTIEQGAAMLYGFGERGFNPHRYVFNVLEEPITMIRHKELYTIHFGKDDIVFYEDMDRFIEELIRVFPSEKSGIEQYYHDFGKLYDRVIAKTPIFVAPDVLDKKQTLEQFKTHPLSYIKFLGYMNKSMKEVLREYFKGEQILQFFDKLTSTYCYATVEEAPAILGAVMFLDNHVGGSYYPVGSTMQLIGKLEKSAEENGADFLYQSKVEEILVENNKAEGVRLSNETVIHADQVIYSGNVWDLYEKLIKESQTVTYEPTYASVVYYAIIKEEMLPDNLYPIEMFISDKTSITEDEITMYLLGLDDKTLEKDGCLSLTAIGPSFRNWDAITDNDLYEKTKEEEIERILKVLQRRIPNIREAIVHQELSTPRTLSRYILKYHGAVAGPKQMLGQHMLKRQHTKTQIEGLYCCGEGTVMGTGTPAVTVSAISAVNLSLREKGLKEYAAEDAKDNYVTIISPPYNAKVTEINSNLHNQNLNTNASLCSFCETPCCEQACPYKIKIATINRKLACSNIIGAKKILTDKQKKKCKKCKKKPCQLACEKVNAQQLVKIKEIIQGI